MKRVPILRNHTDKHSDAFLPLTFANVGLVLFIIAGIFYVEKEWDRFSLLCVLGYISIFAGLLLPELCFVEEVSTTCHPSREIGDKIEKSSRERKWIQFWGSVLMIVGIFLGIVGSLLYSPTIVSIFNDKMMPWIGEANLIWAISFLIFPVGFALLAYEKLMTLRLLAEANLHEELPTIWHPQMCIFLWTEICLILFAIAGVVIVLLPNTLGEVIGMIFFSLGALIKVLLLFREVNS